MSATKIAAPATPRRSSPQVDIGRLSAPRISTKPTAVTDALDRDQMLDRLQHLRTILPIFAQELASARRHAAQLRRDNRRLLAEVHRLQRQHSERTTAS